ncbi:MAG: hypothetical protein KGK05_05580 [Xanthomonadaceae bacterium]|nr:hypothetical protein [Xanthomonadaceae bacterium]
MERIEPTIGSLEIDPNSARDAAPTARRRKRLLRTLIDWLITLGLLAVAVALFYWVMLKAGALPNQFQLGAPKLFERLLIIVGIVVALGSQIIGSFALFRFGFERGALALLLPAYLPFALKRSGIFWAVMGPWCLGILFILAGTILLN